MNSLRTPLHLLFLGCGAATRLHSRVLRGTPDVICSYASRDAERAAAMCAEFGGARSFNSYDAGLGDPGILVALVATPTATHLELTLRALAAGRHVIVEKPAFLTESDAHVAHAAAKAAGLQLFVAENYAYKPLTLELRHAVESGQLGDVRFVSLNATKSQPATGWRADPQLSGGGALFEAGVHWISFAARLGLDIAALHAFRASPAGGADRSSLVVFRYTNGAAGSLAHSWELRAPFGGARLSTIQGTHGAVTFESNGFATFTSGRRRHVRLHLRDTMGYSAMHRDFRRALFTGVAPAYTFDMAARDLHWLDVAQAGLLRPDPAA